MVYQEAGPYGLAGHERPAGASVHRALINERSCSIPDGDCSDVRKNRRGCWYRPLTIVGEPVEWTPPEPADYDPPSQ